MTRANMFSTRQLVAAGPAAGTALANKDPWARATTRDTGVRIKLIDTSLISDFIPDSIEGGNRTLPARRARHPPQVAGRCARLLLAEDDPELRHLLATVLRRDGHHVTEARSGVELLDWVAAELDEHGSLDRFDLIISDIRLPGFSGLDMLASLRTAECPVPVVLITAFGDETTHAQAERLGAAAMFDKPFDVDDLRTTVAHVIDAA